MASIASCELFGYTKQAYYQWLKREPFGKLAVESIVVEFVKEKRKIDPVIGGLKLWSMYSDHATGEAHVGRDKFLSIMAQEGLLNPKRKRKKPQTTNSKHHLPRYPDLRKDVIPERPNQIWASDIAYIDTKDGKHAYSEPSYRSLYARDPGLARHGQPRKKIRHRGSPTGH